MSLLTGSRVYGTPHEDSDLDLVILVTPEEMALFEKHYGAPDTTYTDPKTGDKKKKAPLLDAAFRFPLFPGIDLNLIVTTDPGAYAIWAKGTAELKAKAPVTRDVAVALFTKLREARI